MGEEVFSFYMLEAVYPTLVPREPCPPFSRSGDTMVAAVMVVVLVVVVLGTFARRFLLFSVIK